MRQHRLTIKRRTGPGEAPGALSSDPNAPKPQLWYLRYNENELEEGRISSLTELSGLRKESTTLWINVNGLGDPDILREVGESFDLHPLAIEDIVNTHQRPKVEEYDSHIYVVSRSMQTDKSGSDQLSLFLWRHMVVTFRESPGPLLDPLMARIRQAHGRIRRLPADYLAYCILDVTLDSYFPLLEESDDELEQLEAEVLQGADQTALTRMHEIKHRLAAIRRIVSPMREVANSLIRDSGELIGESTRFYLRDLNDHVIQILELVENQREIVASLLEIYLSSVSNRLNQVMKVLTIIATLFIPLTFIVGVYGMNFDTHSPWNMPELRWQFGYLAVCTIMVLIVALELYLFRRLGWIGKGRNRDNMM